MTDFHFSVPIQVRYGDLDPQWHVNNARFLTYFEHARFSYLIELGLFDGKSFFDVDLIVADIHVAYLAPIELGQQVRCDVRVSRIGNKSLTLEYRLWDEQSGSDLARAETVMVSYDYRQHASKAVPAHWRERISAFEGKDFSQPQS